MGIGTYALLTYGISIVIAYAVIGIVVAINKIMNSKEK